MTIRDQLGLGSKGWWRGSSEVSIQPAATADLQMLINVVGMAKNFVSMIGETANACFHCVEDEDVACFPPQEMTGARRSASAVYVDFVSSKLTDLGLKRCQH